MARPTLLVPGNVVSKKWMSAEEKGKINAQRPIDFIIYRIHRIGAAAGNCAGNKIIILKSGTGSGKSTVLPAELFNTFFDKVRKNICITEPRILTAVDIPIGMLPYNPKLQLGKNIGYQTGSIINRPIRGIIFMTIGILLQQLKTMTDEQIMRRYMFIIIDEVHERDENVDLTLLLLKQFFARNYKNADCPTLILMSATFNEKIYMDYFDVPANNFIEVTGQSFPKKINYSKYAVNNWINEIVDIIADVHINQTNEPADRDIIVFVSTTRQINTLLPKIEELNNVAEINKNGRILPIKLNSATYKEGGKDYNNLFTPLSQLNVARRVIVATNVAETGITIDSLRYCIDTGFVISVEFDPTFAATTIINKNVTQGMSMQRIGRVGRKAPGIAYLLYTREMYNAFLPDQHPQFITSEITNSLLSYIVRNGAPLDYTTLDFITMPAAASVLYSLEKLYILGFITQTKSTLAPYKKAGNGEIVPTDIGVLAIKIRKIRLESIRMIFAGYLHECNILNLITLAVFLEMQWGSIVTVRRRDFDLKEFPQYKMADEFIQFLLIWYIFMDKIKHKDINVIKKWAAENNINYNGMLNIIDRRDELIKNFIDAGHNPFWCDTNEDLLQLYGRGAAVYAKEINKIKKCIYDGYNLNLARFNPVEKKYVMHYKKMPVICSDKTVESAPTYVLFANITLRALGGTYRFFADTICYCDKLMDEGYIDIGLPINYP